MSGIAQSVVAGLGVFFLLHITLWRAKPSNAPRILLLTGLAGVGLVSSGVMALVMSGGAAVEVCAALWLTGFFLTVYFFVYAGVARSVSVTLLSRLLHNRKEPVEFGALLDEYAASTRFQDRIRLMHQTGLLRITGDLVSLTPMGRAFSHGVKILTRLACGELQG